MLANELGFWIQKPQFRSLVQIICFIRTDIWENGAPVQGAWIFDCRDMLR